MTTYPDVDAAIATGTPVEGSGSASWKREITRRAAPYPLAREEAVWISKRCTSGTQAPLGSRWVARSTSVADGSKLKKPPRRAGPTTLKRPKRRTRAWVDGSRSISPSNRVCSSVSPGRGITVTAITSRFPTAPIRATGSEPPSNR